MKLNITGFDWLKIISVNKEIWFKNLTLENMENITVFKRNELFIFVR